MNAVELGSLDISDVDLIRRALGEYAVAHADEMPRCAVLYAFTAHRIHLAKGVVMVVNRRGTR